MAKQADYMIYQTPNNGNTLEFVGRATASSSDQALRRFIASFDNAADISGEFLAFQERWFRRRSIRTVTKVTLRLDEP